MSSLGRKYYCKICNYSCGQRAHIDHHRSTDCHVAKCIDLTNILKADKPLYCKYITELKIDEGDDKTMSQLRQEIIDKLSAIYISEMRLEEYQQEWQQEWQQEVPLYLNHELTQFTRGKTEQTLNEISERYLLNSISNDSHIIQIIVTNKSLLETRQWRVRTKNKMDQYENIDVDILSSDSKSEYHSIHNFISKITMAKTKDELPNILIVCFHKRRIEDMLALFDMFCRPTIMIQNAKLKFHLSFDEPDANIGMCSKFLTKYKKYMKLLVAIEFITATPYDNFWKMLQENDIFKLLNPHNLKKRNHPYLDEKSYTEYLKSYFQIKDHNHLICNHETVNPLEYIEHVFESTYDIFDTETHADGKSIKIGEAPYIDMTDQKRKIIFSPAHLYTNKKGVGSHEEVAQFYNQLGFTVYLSNGKFKGFIEPSGERMTLDAFNEKYNITGELRDTMRKWSEMFPLKNIAITGYWTIERGITFQTNGFNFTHAIISDYHKFMLNKLLQLIGRVTGNKLYIQDKCNLICPQHIIDTVNTLVNKTIELRKENPENYNSTDFSEKNSSIPVKLTFVDDEYRSICIDAINGRRNYKQHLHSLLKNGYETGKIVLEDRNNVHVFTNDSKDKTGNTKLFDDIHKSISNVKMYSLSDTSPQSRRFAQFNNAFNTYKPTSQTGEIGEYSIDLAKDRYEYNGFINEPNIAWITFRHE